MTDGYASSIDNKINKLVVSINFNILEKQHTIRYNLPVIRTTFPHSDAMLNDCILEV